MRGSSAPERKGEWRHDPRQSVVHALLLSVMNPAGHNLAHQLSSVSAGQSFALQDAPPSFRGDVGGPGTANEPQAVFQTNLIGKKGTCSIW